MILCFSAISNLYANVNNNNQVHDDLYDPRLQRRLQPLAFMKKTWSKQSTLSL